MGHNLYYSHRDKIQQLISKNVLAHFLEHYKKRWPDRPFIPLENRKKFLVRHDYKEQLGITNPNEVYEEEGWFLSLKPVPGAIETFQYLKKRDDIEVFICSSPCTNYKYCVTEKYQWVEKHLGKDAIGCLMLTKDKTIVNVRKYLSKFDVKCWGIFLQ